VITKHKITPQEGDPFSFYLLYLHLLPLEEDTSKNFEKAIPVYFESVVSVKYEGAEGAGLSLADEYGREIMVMPKGTHMTFQKKEREQWAVAAGYYYMSFSFQGRSYKGYAKIKEGAKYINAKWLGSSMDLQITTDQYPNRFLSGLRIFDSPLNSAQVISIAPCFSELDFVKPADITDKEGKFKSSALNTFQEIKGYYQEGKLKAVKGYVKISESHLEVKQRFKREVDKVVNCDIELRKGDVLGWTGNDGTGKDKRTIHLEAFIRDDTNFNAFKAYTDRQIQSNPDLANQNLIRLESVLREGSLTDAYNESDFIADVKLIIDAAIPEAAGSLKSIGISAAVKKKAYATKLRRIVTKHPSEWLSPDSGTEAGQRKEGHITTRLTGIPYAWSTEKVDAFKELLFDKLGFWHELQEKTKDIDYGPDGTERNVIEYEAPFPEEAYFFHPIKLIEHLNKIGYKTYGGYELQYNDKDKENTWGGAKQLDEGTYVKELQKHQKARNEQ
jgi:hypothetical protein